jgi:hypothetical protein
MNFNEYVENFGQWKLKEKGTAKVTKAEVAKLRESFEKKLKQSKNKSPKEALKERVSKYREWKIANGKGKEISQKEFDGLKNSLREELSKKTKENSFTKLVENYKKFKTASEGPNSKVTYKELKMLKEAFKNAERKGKKLREADAGMDPTMAGAPPAAPGADPMGADPMAGATPGAGDIQGTITQLESDLAALKAAAGMPTDLGADPMAGTPPVDGMEMPVAGDPNAGTAPLAETLITKYKAWKLKEKGTDKITEKELAGLREQAAKYAQPKDALSKIKERIAARKAAMKSLQENGAQDLASKELSAAGLGTKLVSNSSGGTSDKTLGEEAVKVPAASALANGYTSGPASSETKPAATWPTKDTKSSDTGGALQGSGASQKKIKESEKLDESVLSVTDVYVDRELAPKLDFGRIKESLAKGLLG